MARLMTVADLFAGVGGFSLGFLKANESLRRFKFDLRLLADIDPTASYTFKKNFPGIPYWLTDLSEMGGRDLLKVLRMEAGQLDFLIGGPPCQGFSANGKRILEDSRNKLMARFIDVVHCVLPKCVIIENVPPAISSLERILDAEIQERFSGYRMHVRVLNASEFGVPQIRKRAFIVAFRDDLGISGFGFPKGEFDPVDNGKESHHEQKSAVRFVTVEEAIGDLPSLKSGESIDGIPYSNKPTFAYQLERRKGSIGVFNHIARGHSSSFLEKISAIAPGEGNADLPEGQRFSDNYFSQAYARLHPRGIGFTVTRYFLNPGSGRFTHYRDNRAITAREAARIQSFDDKFIFHGQQTDQQRHIGNAVPPLMAEALARHFGAILYRHA